MSKKNLGITVSKKEDMANWYAQVCLKGELAEYAPVKGCFILRPRGYYVWQSIQNYFNDRLEELKVDNAYFPLFIPESFFSKEAEHAQGFSPEVAWIAGKDEDSGERLAIRPTSETIMYDSYGKWIRSWRDLPLRINQWANVVRWETDQTKLFLRSREFLWQEGHNVYETLEECDIETEMMIKEYRTLAKDLLALPVTIGRKSDKEKFAGAVYTLTMEAFMPDGKALQAGTSHNLGQGFAKAFGVSFQDRDGNNDVLPWQNSWGFSTRLIGGVVMMHSDDKGLILPPRVAKNKVAIIPIIFEDTRDSVIEGAELIADNLKEFNPIIDDREDQSPGFKFSEHELKGVPLRIEFGPKDLDQDSCVIVRRDTGEKTTVEIKDVNAIVAQLLAEIHDNLYKKALKSQEDMTVVADNYDDFKKYIKESKRIQVSFCGRDECETNVKEETGATSRCCPLDDPEPKCEKCFACGQEAGYNFFFSRSY